MGGAAAVKYVGVKLCVIVLCDSCGEEVCGNAGFLQKGVSFCVGVGCECD